MDKEETELYCAVDYGSQIHGNDTSSKRDPLAKGAFA